LDEAREIVFRLLRGGFEDSFDDFVDAVAEACEDHDLEVEKEKGFAFVVDACFKAALDPEDVANIIDEECASFQQEMDKWPAVTDNDKLTNVGGCFLSLVHLIKHKTGVSRAEPCRNHFEREFRVLHDVRID
jgi:hypothetical protein